MSAVTLATELAAPWARVYANSSLLAAVVTFAHLGGLLLGGGCAIAADRMTFRLRYAGNARRREHLAELHAIHRPVLIGLTVTLLSGVLLLAADFESLLPAPLFWIKMGLIMLLLANGAVLRRAETRLRRQPAADRREWRTLHRAAWVSVTLWFGSVLLGTALLAL